jgi:hypothetical protein
MCGARSMNTRLGKSPTTKYTNSKLSILETSTEQTTIDYQKKQVSYTYRTHIVTYVENARTRWPIKQQLGHGQVAPS